MKAKTILNLSHRLSWVTDKAETCDTKHYGRGVFATSSIAKGETIAFFGGHIVHLSEVDLLDISAQDTAFQISEDFVCVYKTEAEIGLWESGNAGDYFNHSCEPNCGFNGQIRLVALREIDEGEELTFDYAMCLTSSFGDMDCLCGKIKCRRRVTGDDWLLPELQVTYLGYFQPYIEEKIERLNKRTAAHG